MRGDWYNKMTKEQAIDRANKLKKRLEDKVGGKWKIRVHENGGWHYNVYAGTISVSQYEPKRYSCLIGDGEWQGTGSGIWTIDNNATTPEESVKIQMTAMMDEVTKLQGVVAKNIKVCNKMY